MEKKIRQPGGGGLRGSEASEVRESRSQGKGGKRFTIILRNLIDRLMDSINQRTFTNTFSTNSV